MAVRGSLDSVIVIDLLRGLPEAGRIMSECIQPAISIVTWIEVLVGPSGAEEQSARALLSTLKVIPITSAIAEQAVLNRRTLRLKLPDAMILATAQVESYILLTRNTKDFAEDQLGVRIPYRF